MEKSNGKIEQYQRRLCLRKNRFDLTSEDDKKTSEDCFAKFKNDFENFGFSIHPYVIDSAYHVGTEIQIDNSSFFVIYASANGA